MRVVIIIPQMELKKLGINLVKIFDKRWYKIDYKFVKKLLAKVIYILLLIIKKFLI